MTHALSVPATRSTNLMPLYVIGFCLLWSASFVAGKIGVTECPPLILLTVRFLAAGILILWICCDTWRWMERVTSRRFGFCRDRYRQ